MLRPAYFVKIWACLTLFFLAMPFLARAEIIDERTERFCEPINETANHCTLVSYGKDTFINHDNQWKSHLGFLDTGEWLENHDLYFQYDNGDWVLYRPVIVFQDEVHIVDDLLQVYDFEWEQFLTNDKHSSKNEIRFKKHKDIDYVGLQIFSNLPIDYIDYEYVREGDWEEGDDYLINTTDLVLGNYRISFVDLANDGFNYEYNKIDDVLWIDVRDETGIVSLDPSEQFTSLSNDGYLTYTGWITPPFVCAAANDGDTTVPVGSNYLSDSETWGHGIFNTSSIPDDATVTSHKKQVYVNSLVRSKRYTPSNTIVKYYSSMKMIPDPLDCTIGVSTFAVQGNLDWGTSLGYKNKTLSNVTGTVNLTGTTTIREIPNWEAAVGKFYNALYRASEYGGTTQQKYFVEYTEAVQPAEFINTSFLATGFNISDFQFASATYTEVFFSEFNTSSEDNLTLLNMMNVEKISGGGTNIVSIRIDINGVEVLEEDLRTVSTQGSIGSTGTKPLVVNLTAGQHNISYNFKRTGSGTIGVDDIDAGILLFTSAADDKFFYNLIDANFNYSSTTFEDNYNFTVTGLNSSKFLYTKQTLWKSGTGSTTATLSFKDITLNTTSPKWLRYLSDSSDLGSVAGLWFEFTSELNDEHSIYSRHSDSGDYVFVNSTILHFDMTDEINNTVQGFQASNLATEGITGVNYAAGLHNIANDNVQIFNGTGMMFGGFVSVKSDTGSQEIMFKINSSEVPEGLCYTKKERTLSTTNDIGNIFMFAVCQNLTIGDSYTFNLWMENTKAVTLYDENIGGMEVTNFSLTEEFIEPEIPSDNFNLAIPLFLMGAGIILIYLGTSVNIPIDKLFYAGGFGIVTLTLGSVHNLLMLDGTFFSGMSGLFTLFTTLLYVGIMGCLVWFLVDVFNIMRGLKFNAKEQDVKSEL